MRWAMTWLSNESGSTIYRAIVDLIAQGHEVIAHGTGQVGMINRLLKPQQN